MKSQEIKKAGAGQFIMQLFKNQIFIPIAALLLLAIFNLIMDPSFYKITLDTIVSVIPFYQDI